MDDTQSVMLPERVHAMRLHAMTLPPDERETHVARNIVILWDDPERRPGVSEPTAL
jgi:hypothetical protein